MQLTAQPLFMALSDLIPHALIHLKIEGLNIAGSIKLKTAMQMVEDMEHDGVLRAGGTIIESSSGNLGLALAIICAARKYHFICVTDPNVPSATARLMRVFGARVIIVNERDEVGGFLHTRLRLIQRMVREDPALVWTNQYANPSNIRAHYRMTAAEILQEFPRPDFVFIGTGTTGTAMGCARYLRERSPRTQVIAVDSVGSVTFGGRPGSRHLPGLGTSRRPEIADASQVDDIVMVPEREAIRMCRRVVRDYGLLLGPSSGTVLAGLQSMAAKIPPGAVVVAISPDLGDRYIDTAYDDHWVESRFCVPEDEETTIPESAYVSSLGALAAEKAL